jgi:chemotaxis protein methyltransferase CheR
MSSSRLVSHAQLGPEEFRLLRDRVYEFAGLHFDDDAMYLFERRLVDRVEALGLDDFYSYYKYLRFHPQGGAELEDAIDRLTTKETYLFRQEYQLRAFRDQILPELHEANRERKRLAIWSAGCSTGEEAYTIAILILESRRFADWDVKVVGSDLCKASVAFARRGIYRETAFRTTSDDLRHRYFLQNGQGWEVAAEAKKICHFGQLNLMDGGRALMAGQVDVIFCRNVLIYFDMKSRRKVIDGFYERLVPGGYLLLGHSESLLNLSTAFELCHLREDLVYRKPRGASPFAEGAR